MNTPHLAVVLLCIDYRFWPEALPLLEAKYGTFDLIEIAGASKSLVSPLEEEDRVTLLENIGISVNLHHPERLILTNHTDCGAYGGSAKFASHEEELAFHREELRKAKIHAAQKFPDLQIELVIVDKVDGHVRLVD